MTTFYGFSASNKTEKHLFEFYFLQSPNSSFYGFVYVGLYYCHKYFKTVHSLSVFMKYVPDEVLYVLTRTF